MGSVKITQKQAPLFRAMIKKLNDELFDPGEDLATRAELDAEGLTNVHPISYTVYKSQGGLTPYVADSNTAEPVPGYQNKEIDASAIMNPAEVEQGQLDYNFSFTPANRSTFAFPDVGWYFVDFQIMPKEGNAIIFRVNVEAS